MFFTSKGNIIFKKNEVLACQLNNRRYISTARATAAIYYPPQDFSYWHGILPVLRVFPDISMHEHSGQCLFHRSDISRGISLFRIVPDGVDEALLILKGA